MTKINRLKGGLYGLLIGDALGVPYECHPASAIPARELIDMTPPARFRRCQRQTGTWSDDGALALGLLDSLIEKDGLDLSNLAVNFLRGVATAIWQLMVMFLTWATKPAGHSKI